MNVLAIHGSYHKEGNISKLVDLALEGAKESGADQVDKIALLDKNIQFCDNCMKCLETSGGGKGEYRCPMQDDMQGIIDRIDQADHLILASPVNITTVTALFKRFAERCVASFTVMKIKEAVEMFPEMMKPILPPLDQVPPEVMDLHVPFPRTMPDGTSKAIVITSGICPMGMMEQFNMIDSTVGVLEFLATNLGFAPFKRVVGAGISITPAGQGNSAEKEAFEAGNRMVSGRGAPAGM